MRDLCRLIGWMVVDLIRSRVMLEAEIWTLRQQINVLRRTAPKKLSFCAVDRMIFVGLYRLFPKICDALAIVKPATLVRWHRAGFRSYWRWTSRRRGGRPIVPVEIRRLIREMSIANPLWGAPRIHGELLKLGIDIGGVTPNDDAHPEHMRSLRKSATSGRLRLFFLGGNLPAASIRVQYLDRGLLAADGRMAKVSWDWMILTIVPYYLMWVLISIKRG